LADHAEDKQFPLSLLLDVFQSLQRRNIPYMLVLTGLPTLSTKLVEARTYSERMFHTLFLNRLQSSDAREAILRPVTDGRCPITFSDETVNLIIEKTAGYPYFIQFFCREVFDVWIAKIQRGEVPGAPIPDITRKLDADFFHGRWAKATDRQCELLQIVSLLPNADQEFTVQEVVAVSKGSIMKPFTPNAFYASRKRIGLQKSARQVFAGRTTVGPIYSTANVQRNSPQNLVAIIDEAAN
jgi:hypothetical protein